MKVSKRFEEKLQIEIAELEGYGNLSEVTECYILTVSDMSDRTISDIGKYARIQEQFGHYVSVEVPIKKVASLLEKNYVVKAERDVGVTVLATV